ncbi:hypothetical protein ACFW9F_17190 [Streptomyces sp. NPDC059506]|uniref:SCO4983 family protein n=1 Tax=unclassified Streptomyces TaxID=2593676 RepID=UPI0015F8EB2D|nr:MULTISPECIES: hypothetical protein [unclassified Streptomyces]MCZ2527664.1 hypothetical protein [Streptomyces sp. HB2AG]QMV21972.1 hypothetical protein GQS52_09470 [Streptomyces sp. SCUT-3]
MYEPIRSKSVHSTSPSPEPPRRSREEELDIQLAGHLAALLTVTDELRASAPSPDLDRAAEEIARRISGLRSGRAPARLGAQQFPSAADSPGGAVGRVAELHRRAHTLAGRVLVVAASRQDTATAVLACRRMDAHEAEAAAVPA